MSKTKETQLYHYHPETGEYLGETIATLDPIDKEPLVPANATTIPIPNTVLKPDEAYAFNGVVLKKVSDYRGQKFYTKDGEEVEVKNIAEEPEESWSIKKPKPPKPSTDKILKGIKLEAAKRIKESGHDWMAIRQVTTGKKVPNDIIEYANDIRKTSNKLEEKLPADFTNNKYWPEII